MEILDSESMDIYSFIMKNSYFVVLFFVVVAFVLSQFFSKDFNLDNIKNLANTNFIESINTFLGELWLSSNMKNDTIFVENNQKEGLLDRIVENIDN
jgi:hypothetical protein